LNNQGSEIFIDEIINFILLYYVIQFIQIKNSSVLYLKAIKKIFCSGLVLVLFLHTNYLAVYYSLYKINTEELTASCCEKKVDNCNAHCYLDKKMNEENDKGKTSGAPELKLKLTEYIVSEFAYKMVPEKIIDYQLYKIFMPQMDYYSRIEHPPQV